MEIKTQQLTFTRFIAALFIVFFHFTGNMFPVKSEFIHSLRENLNLGVSYFFVLSGFVMILAYDRKNRVEPKNYFINRIARIYPLHIFTLILRILVIIFVTINYLRYLHFQPVAFILNFSLLQAWFPSISLSFNEPSWSISVEMFFYLTFPFIFNRLYKKFNLLIFGLIVIGFWVISQISLNYFYLSKFYGGKDSLDRYFIYYNPLFHLNSFAVGILLAAIFKKYQNKLSGNFDAYIIFWFAFNALLIYVLRHLLLHNGLLAIPFGVLILLIAGNTGRITTIFNHKFLIHLGNISFALYLLQNPVFIFVKKCLSIVHLKNDYLLFSVAFPILLICSHYTYKLIEIPFQTKIRNRFK